MRFISRRDREAAKPQADVQIVIERSNSFSIIVTDANVATDAEIERAKRVLEDIRRQLEQFGGN